MNTMWGWPRGQTNATAGFLMTLCWALTLPAEPDPVEVPFDLTLPGVIGQGNLTISLWGYYDTGHEVEVWVNDVSQGTFSWSGIAFYEVNLSGLNLTENTTVKLACHTAMDGLDC